MDEFPADVITVAACLRGGDGGSPTAVVTDSGGFGDAELARIPARMGTSHVAAIAPGVGARGEREVRFFTATGELPGCGHGTVAAIAVLTLQAAGAAFQGPLRVAGKDVEATGGLAAGSGEGDVIEAWFSQGLVEHRAATDAERCAFLAALGLAPDALHPKDDVSIASPGSERLLIPVTDRAVLAGIRPDQERLAVASRRHGQLGCFVYVPPSLTEPAAARMFAPAIGVPEDVANANSTGCLAAHLLLSGHLGDSDPTVAVDQGDALGHPSTVHATATRTPRGITTQVGGTARVLPQPS
ncbi:MULTISPECIES: PhzF family phenazine biosynthesis protein [unclassified Pseudofrankia]|uniref:PhzF family phenazine biosynthesis protein n=1 Tax=unclassified Pseudofrankia TaxID=2994372 RepID=UPI0008DB28C7|nr:MULTISPECIES: PhzF family phenazine biosynthesis isomerase [unclassified Pseudofrankia]MDT3441069.1 PhzF family phenazine biosynthesis isomerase [Pseudofrankia sp. BMG5.37]OHV42570.1 phenazine biosynthesis protein PhzF [Pseudofrankia sp. BMG5.36]